MKKVFILVLSLAMVLTIFVGCADNVDTEEQDSTDEEVVVSDSTKEEDVSGDVDPEEVEEGYLNLYWQYINETKDGFFTTNQRGNYIETSLIWDTLVRFIPETGEMVYLLAEEITANEDYTMFTIKLKKDVVWHDGTPFTAEDVVFTYNAAIFGHPSSAKKLATVKGFDAAINGEADTLEGVYSLDEYTVVFELTESNANYMVASSDSPFSNGYYSIIPKHLFEGVEWADYHTADYWRNPMGTGPYIVDEKSYPEYCTLVRFDNYHGELPGIKNIKLTAYNDAEAAYAAAMAGDLDLIRNLTVVDGENIVAQNPDCEITIFNSGFARTLQFNLQNDAEDKVFQDPQVRKAFNLIIDKQAIVEYYGTVSSVATTYNNNKEYNDDIPVWKRDVEKGMQMLEDAGYDFSKKLKMLAYYTDQATVDVFDIIVANLAEAGIEAEYVIDGSTAFDQWCAGGFDLYYYGGGGTNTEFYSYLGFNRAGEYHFDGFDEERREQYNALWSEYVGTTDLNEKKKIAGELQVLFVEDMYTVPLYFVNTVYLVNSAHLQGYKGMSTDDELYAYLGLKDWSLIQ